MDLRNTASSWRDSAPIIVPIGQASRPERKALSNGPKMDEIEHTIAELMGVPMEDWPEWLERREIPAVALRAIEHRLIGRDATVHILDLEGAAYERTPRRP